MVGLIAILTDLTAPAGAVTGDVEALKKKIEPFFLSFRVIFIDLC